MDEELSQMNRNVNGVIDIPYDTYTLSVYTQSTYLGLMENIIQYEVILQIN